MSLCISRKKSDKKATRFLSSRHLHFFVCFSVDTKQYIRSSYIDTFVDTFVDSYMTPKKKTETFFF